MGGALWLYDLKSINTPLDNFGIKSWRNIPGILEKKFKDYWLLENLSTGKIVEEISGRHGDKRLLLKAYDNKYNLVSNHNFLAEENPSGTLVTYPDFRKKLDFLTDVFLAQCARYDRIRFVLKAMDWPDPENTKIELETIENLVDSLAKLRGGKYFDLYISVPEREFEKVKRWEPKSPDFPVRISKWTIKLDNAKSKEWEALLEGFELDADYYWKLVSGIIGNGKINLEDANKF